MTKNNLVVFLVFVFLFSLTANIPTLQAQPNQIKLYLGDIEYDGGAADPDGTSFGFSYTRILELFPRHNGEIGFEGNLRWNEYDGDGTDDGEAIDLGVSGVYDYYFGNTGLYAGVNMGPVYSDHEVDGSMGNTFDGDGIEFEWGTALGYQFQINQATETKHAVELEYNAHDNPDVENSGNESNIGHLQELQLNYSVRF